MNITLKEALFGFNKIITRLNNTELIISNTKLLKQIATLLNLDIGNLYDDEDKIIGHWLDINLCLKTYEITEEDVK